MNLCCDNTVHEPQSCSTYNVHHLYSSCASCLILNMRQITAGPWQIWVSGSAWGSPRYQDMAVPYLIGLRAELVPVPHAPVWSPEADEWGAVSLTLESISPVLGSLHPFKKCVCGWAAHAVFKDSGALVPQDQGATLFFSPSAFPPTPPLPMFIFIWRSRGFHFSF